MLFSISRANRKQRIANGHANAAAEQVLAATGEAGDSLSAADYAALVNKTLAK